MYTIGHSTRAQHELVELLTARAAGTLIDIRRFPSSARNPQFNAPKLAAALARAGIDYVHVERLGGRRKGAGGSVANAAWRNRSFRAFADYMATEDFEAGLETVLDRARRGPVAVMCSEALPWRCHRALIADALLVRGVPVFHIYGRTRAAPHTLTPFARAEGLRVTYPLQPVEP